MAAISEPVVFVSAMVVTMFTLREVLSAVFLSTGSIQMAMAGVFDYWEEGNLEEAAVLATLLTLLQGSRTRLPACSAPECGNISPSLYSDLRFRA